MASNGSDGSGGSWPTSLGTPETDGLIRVRLMVPSGCRLSHAFRITADGYPTRGPGASRDVLRRHEGGRWNIVGSSGVADGRLVVCTGRLVVCPAPAPPSPSGGHAVSKLVPPSGAHPRRARLPPAVEIPSEQFALREDDDPNDCPGYLIALRASQAEAAVAEAREAAELQVALNAAAAMAAAAEAAELQAALDAAAGIGAVQAQAASVEDDAADWDDGGKSSDDDSGDGDGGAGEIVDLAASYDE
ncbi:hypothetical protein VPH35_138683 [Triticum aestivum]